MNYQQKTSNLETSYIPDDTLLRYLNRLLHHQKTYLKVTSAREKLSDEDKRERANIQRLKSATLNKHVFRAMANITTFLEWSTLPALQEIFEEDIEELLLGANRNKNFEHAKSKKQPWFKTENWNQPVLARFLYAILSWNIKEDKDNFRLKILPILIRVIYDYLSTITQGVLATAEDPSLNSPAGKIADEKFHEIMNNQLISILGFIDLLTKDANMKKGKINRPVLF